MKKILFSFLILSIGFLIQGTVTYAASEETEAKIQKILANDGGGFFGFNDEAYKQWVFEVRRAYDLNPNVEDSEVPTYKEVKQRLKQNPQPSGKAISVQSSVSGITNTNASGNVRATGGKLGAVPPGYNGPIFDGEGLQGGTVLTDIGLHGNISKEKSLLRLMASWIRFLLPILAFAAVVAIIYAGYAFVIGGGDDGRYEKAKGIVIWVVAGLLLALGAFAIVNTLLDGVT